MDKSEEKITSLIVKHINGLLGGSSSPSVPEELAGNGEFVVLHNKLMELRLIISDFAKGNLRSGPGKLDSCVSGLLASHFSREAD